VNHALELRATFPRDIRRVFLNPGLLIFVAFVVNTVFQIAMAGSSWSSFQIFGVTPDWDVLGIYLLGFLVFFISYEVATVVGRKLPPFVRFRLNERRFNALAQVLFFANVISFVASQLAMGDAHIFNLFAGGIMAIEIQDAIKESPFGVHGLSLLVGYFAVAFWGIQLSLNQKNRWVTASILIATLKCVAYATAQGLLYILFCYLALFQRAIPIRKAIFGAVAILGIFLVTRIMRNPDQTFDFGYDLIISFVFGLYFGSPVSNTSYVFQYPDAFSNLLLLFTQLLPHKLVPVPDEIIGRLPDISSPLGLVGTAFASGGYLILIPYCALVGYGVGWLTRKARIKFEYLVFSPFLFVACAFSMMYNHFLSLNSFWLPLLFCILICKLCRNR
jgi:hypothetical protein